MIDLNDARDLILQYTPVATTETVFLEDAFRRVLAEPIIAQIDIPPFNRSPLDGYAFRAEDTRKASLDKPVVLKIVTVIGAGDWYDHYIKPGTCVRIMTGAPIPPGANAVIPQEKVKRKGHEVLIFSSFEPGKDVVCAGEDIRCGENVIDSGIMLDVNHLGVIASLGRKKVAVYRKPKIAVIVTGSELVGRGKPLPPGGIYNSNDLMISALVEKYGAEPLTIGVAEDRMEALTSLLLEGLISANAIVTTGGVSAGDYDLLGDAIKNIGAKLIFWRVAIKPGTPMLVAIKEGQLIFCLSGSPAAAYITFEQLVRPSLLKMIGINNWRRPKVQAALEHNLFLGKGQNRFIRAVCSYSKDSFYVRVAGHKRPGAFSLLAYANSFIFLPTDSPSLFAGDKVTVELFDAPLTPLLLDSHNEVAE